MQYPGQKAAAPAYLKDLASPPRPALEDAKGATSPVTDAMIPASCEAPTQPLRAKLPLYDPLVASDQTQATECLATRLRRAPKRFCATVAVPKIAARPISG